MITLMGTGHVFKLRDRVKEKIVEKRPEAVCLELDKKRHDALLQGKIDLNPLSLFQQSVAAIYGERAGNDMLGGIEGSKEVGAKLFLIDRGIEETMRRLMYASINEFFNPMEIIRKFFAALSIPLETPTSVGDFFSLSFKDFIEKAVREFEAEPEKYRGLLGNLYPFYKRVLLDEREEYMAKEIRKVVEEHGCSSVVAVVGAGHLPNLVKLLSPLEVEIIKLSEML